MKRHDAEAASLKLAETLNAVMGAEADQLCGGANSRNGYRERALATCVGTLTLGIPKLCSGCFLPEDVIERHQRVDCALVIACSSSCLSMQEEHLNSLAQTIVFDKMSD